MLCRVNSAIYKCKYIPRVLYVGYISQIMFQICAHAMPSICSQ